MIHLLRKEGLGYVSQPFGHFAYKICGSGFYMIKWNLLKTAPEIRWHLGIVELTPTEESLLHNSNDKSAETKWLPL